HGLKIEYVKRMVEPSTISRFRSAAMRSRKSRHQRARRIMCVACTRRARRCVAITTAEWKDHRALRIVFGGLKKRDYRFLPPILLSCNHLADSQIKQIT